MIARSCIEHHPIHSAVCACNTSSCQAETTLLCLHPRGFDDRLPCDANDVTNGWPPGYHLTVSGEPIKYVARDPATSIDTTTQRERKEQG